MYRSIILLIFLCCVGCSSSSDFISAQTSYITRQSRASYHVGTPDPFLCYPLAGQNLLIKWSLPTSLRSTKDLYITATIRFKDRSENTLVVPIHIPNGIYLYSIKGEEFCEKGGISTYKIDLYGDGCLLYEWKHQLWVDLIILENSAS